MRPIVAAVVLALAGAVMLTVPDGPDPRPQDRPIPQRGVRMPHSDGYLLWQEPYGGCKEAVPHTVGWNECRAHGLLPRGQR